MGDWIEDARARCEAATPGPWRIDEDHYDLHKVCAGDYWVSHCERMHNAIFIANAYADLPRALDALVKSKAALSAVLPLLEDLAAPQPTCDEDGGNAASEEDARFVQMHDQVRDALKAMGGET